MLGIQNFKSFYTEFIKIIKNIYLGIDMINRHVT